MTIKDLIIGAGVVSFLGGAAGLGGAFGSRVTNADHSPPRATPVAVQLVEHQASYEVERYFTGRVVARRASDLGFERSGKLTAVLVDEGQKIVKGAPIARLDTALLAAQLQSAQAGVAAARAHHDELLAGARPFVVAQARARVGEREAEFREVFLRHERLSQLLGSNVAAQSDCDEAEQQVGAAEARVVAAKQALADLEAGTRSERLAEQAAVVVQQEARVAELEIELENSTLRAPYDAIVSERNLDEGTVVAGGTAVVRLVEDAAPEARIGVPLEAAGEFEVGEQVTVKIGTRCRSAEVVALLPELDPTTRTRPLVVRVSGAAAPGEIVRLTVRDTVEANGCWIPVSALTRATRGLWSCYALEQKGQQGEETTISRRAVEVVFTDGERAYVRGTLRDGDRIVRAGTDRVVVGQRVVVTD